MVKSGKNSKKNARARKRSGFLTFVPDKFKYFYSRRKKTTLLVSILLAGLLIYGGLIFGEFLQFKRVESKINHIHQATLKEFGSPSDENIDGSCGYANDVYRKGLPTCGYDLYLSYKVTDIDQASGYAKRYATEIIDKSSLGKPTYNTEAREFPVIPTTLYGTDYVSAGHRSLLLLGMHCDSAIRYNQVDQRVIFSVSCYKSSAKLPYYKTVN